MGCHKINVEEVAEYFAIYLSLSDLIDGAVKPSMI